MKILICGSRNIELKNKDFIFKTLDDIVSKEQYFTEKKIPNVSLEILSGNNKGADYIGELWAKKIN